MKFLVIVPKIRISLDPTIRSSWCEENIGLRYKDWTVVHNKISNPYADTTTFAFLTEHAATLFALRWAGVEV